MSVLGLLYIFVFVKITPVLQPPNKMVANVTRNKIAINLKSNRHYRYGENLSHRPTVSSRGREVVLAKVQASLGCSKKHSASHDDR